MSKLSKIKDVDREILSKLDDIELLKVCSIDKYTWNTVCDDDFLRRRLLAKYPEIEQYKETWKNFFLKAVKYIASMKEKFNYVYTFGDFKKQYKLLKKYNNKWNKLLIESSSMGELALVIWSMKNGANDLNMALWLASKNVKHLNVVKYLLEHGADIHDKNDFVLRNASGEGKLEMVKFLVENGANIHALNDDALRYASYKGHLEVVKYLLEQGADIHAGNDEALRNARDNGYLEIVNYLESKM